MLNLGDKVFVQNTSQRFEGEVVEILSEGNSILTIKKQNKERTLATAFLNECTKIKEYSS